MGDDVTANVRTIRSIPLVLSGDDWPRYFEMRGEIYMPRAVFAALNREKEEIGEQPFANPRNAAAGTLGVRRTIGGYRGVWSVSCMPWQAKDCLMNRIGRI